MFSILTPVRVAELTGVAAGYEPEAITPVIQPLYDDLWQRLANAGLCKSGPALAYYEDPPAGDGAVVVHAAAPVTTGSVPGVSIVDLAEVESAAAIIHHGSMDDVLPTGQALARWIDANGYRSAPGATRRSPTWVTPASSWRPPSRCWTRRPNRA